MVKNFCCRELESLQLDCQNLKDQLEGARQINHSKDHSTKLVLGEINYQIQLYNAALYRVQSLERSQAVLKERNANLQEELKFTTGVKNELTEQLLGLRESSELLKSKHRDLT